jgi:hypothetical protein
VAATAEDAVILFRGKAMKGSHVLARLKVPPGTEIRVNVSHAADIILRSGRYPIGPPPDDFEDRIRRVVAATGPDELGARQCLRLNNYDVDRVLEGLNRNG